MGSLVGIASKIVLLSIMISIYLIIKILNRKDINEKSRLKWVLIVFLIPFFGSILYLFNKKKIEEK